MTRIEKERILRRFCDGRQWCLGCPVRRLDSHGACKPFVCYTDDELDDCLAAIDESVPEEPTGEPSATVREKVLTAAVQAVCGHRATDYGPPEDNFGAIAMLWGIYKGTHFTATDVAMMMALLKIARIKSGTATTDSFVDLAGYAACAAECAEREQHG